MKIEFEINQTFYEQIEKAANASEMPIDVFCAQVIGKHLVEKGFRAAPAPVEPSA
jgi:hypothetical protein